jgi:hypothetical protein
MSMSHRACLLLVVMVVLPMQSIGGNNDGAYTLYMFPLTPRAPCPWFGMLAVFRAMAAEVR